jgi:glycosyltransferase involved in cell wall biosynthesis
MIKLSVVMPCYNEAGSLPRVFEVCREAVASNHKVEFIFVNNGSTDNSAEVFKHLMAAPGNGFAKLTHIEKNIGYGYGILTGLAAASGEVCAWTHADMQTDPADVILAYEKYKKELLNGNCLVKGKRMGRKLFDNFFTISMSMISSFLLKAKLEDVNAQPKIFNRSLLAKLDKAPHDFSLDLYLLYISQKANMRIISYPVFFKSRIAGESKGGDSIKGKIKLTKRTFAFILKLRDAIKKGER